MAQANYFAQREGGMDVPAAPEKVNFFSSQQAEIDKAALEEVEELPITQQLEGVFGSAEDYKSPAGHAQTATSDAISYVGERIVDMGFTAAKALIPDDWEDAIVDFSEASWTKLMQNPKFAEGIGFAKDGLEAYQGWADENPDLSRRLEEVINISSVAGSKLVPSKAGDFPQLERKVAAKDLSNRKVGVSQMMEPIGKKGEGNLVINPKTKVKEYVPSKWEQEVNDVVVRTPGVNPKTPFTDNMNAVRNRALSYKDELDTLVLKIGGDIDKQKVLTGLANKVNNLHTETLLSGNALDMGIKIYGRAQELIKASDGTAAGLLQARRDLDKWVNGQRKTFDSDFETATGIALREVRNFLNDTVADATGSPHVKTLLDKQHKLLTAGDALESKALREADGRIGRMIQKWEDKTGGKVPTTPLAQAASAVYLGSKAAVVAPVGALFGMYKGLKWLGTNHGKLWLNQMKKAAAQSPFLKPEVLALQQLADGLGPTEEE